MRKACLLMLLVMTCFDTASAEEISIVFVGPGIVLQQGGSAVFTGINVGLTGLDLNKPAELRALLGYHYGRGVDVVFWDNNTGDGRSIYMPEVSLNLELNLLALPTIRRALVSGSNLTLIAGGEVGISYLPFYYNGEPPRYDPVGMPIDSGDRWHWDHAAWNYHLMAGLMLDRALGGMVYLNIADPISGELQFRLEELRFGVAYKL